MTKPAFIDALFLEHPRSVGESYGQHCATAWSFGSRMFVGACAAFIHGLLPGLCKTTASGIVRELNQRLEQGRRAT
jgi:hypothetical protein